MQTVEDGISRMPNAKVFSVLDSNHGLGRSKQVTFNILFGRYRYTRLPFGIASAPEVFYNTMVYLFQYIEGVDDLVMWEEDVEQDDVRLRQVLDRAVVSTTLSLTRRNAIFEHLKLIMWAMC